MSVSVSELARELQDAFSNARTGMTPLSARYPEFDLATGYAVGAELTKRRRAQGHVTVGRKVGYANKAAWRALKLATVVWAPMYDDTVRYAQMNTAAFSMDGRMAPKIEPEIVFKLKEVPSGDTSDAATVLAAAEWLALGFEIIDAPFLDWKLQPPDFVAAYGVHAGLIVGEARPIERDSIPALVDQLASFKVRLQKNGTTVTEGSGRNVLRSPALSLGELAAALAREANAEPLESGELISTGTLTESQPIARGEIWMASLDGLDLPPLTARIT